MNNIHKPVRFAVWLDTPYQKYDWFNPGNPLNCDGWLEPFFRIKRAIEQTGGVCDTQNYYLSRGIVPDIVLFLDIPARPVARLLGAWNSAVRKWLFIQESEVIIPRNWEMNRHAQFEKIFTWDDSRVDNKKYFKLNYTHAFPELIPQDAASRKGFCVVIAGNKRSSHLSELYSCRIEAIRWFERYHPGELDLYGRGWDEYLFTGSLPFRALNRIKPLRRLLAPKFPSYKGEVAQKRSVLQQYRFCICYENAAFPGYITEKIFDCFFSGVVPVYWGAPNVLTHIPSDCFIDKRSYSSYEELYSKMRSMTEVDFLGYLQAVRSFLAGDAARQFSADAFVETLLAAVAK